MRGRKDGKDGKNGKDREGCGEPGREGPVDGDRHPEADADDAPGRATHETPAAAGSCPPGDAPDGTRAAVPGADTPDPGAATPRPAHAPGIPGAPGIAVGWAVSVDRPGRADGRGAGRSDPTAATSDAPVDHTVPEAAAPAPSHVPPADFARPSPDPRSVPERQPGDSAADALRAVSDELAALAEHLRADGQSAESDIVSVAALIATDPALRTLAGELVDGGLTAAEAVVAAANRHADALAALGDPLFADRAADVRHIGRRAAAILAGNDRREPAGDLVLLGDELAAADLLAPGRSPVAAVSVRGGPTGHLAVVARALGIPLVLGVAPEVLRGADAHRVLVDGDRGSVAVDPDVADIVPRFPVPDEHTQPLPPRPTHTRDGHRILVGANVGSHREALAARQYGAEYVGLLRTELPFLGTDHWPDSDEHTAALVPLLRDGPEGPVVVRTLDFAADKRPGFAADDPAACRSDDVLRAQFAGILAAGATTAHPVRILLPMVADAADFAHCRRLLADTCRTAGTREPPLGAMVERESAVADAEALAEAADFLSVGTNDLTPALIGLARHDPRLVPAMAGTPTVLRALQRVVAAGHAHDRKVSVCGDAAAEPSVLPLLVGLGVDAVSVAPPALAAVRTQIAGLDVTRCAESARRRLATNH
ncbi:putative PEP-binding protein [Uniformispora flossi]|uniref:putative PEP-binding protein n=1 Tax=Uniformispora flossi TaxID=3390723 RepID=UPI003C2F7283